ncbi:hypothetical protein BJ170DRAFT_683381 [Xylariales sp. AK1849]|nr:hypothetical protein BJ170DRAFT_683381 [Xylariales sp. AK1849]
MAEIAGLVLGAVPLLISALEHYEDFVEPTVAFFLWKGQLSKVTRRLLMGHTAYEQNMRLLLKQVVSNKDLCNMIDDPCSDLWKNESVVEDLQSKLGHAYLSSKTTIEEIADIMVCIAASLNIDGADKVTQEGLEAIVLLNPPLKKTTIYRERFHFRRRVVFTMRRRAIGNKLGQLEECNARLYGFLEKADKIQNHTQNDESGHRINIQFVAPLQNIQENASKIHRVLHRSWCTAHGSHRAGLLLEQRLLRRRKNWRRLPQAVGNVNCFGISIWRMSALSWLDTEFSLDESSNMAASAQSTPRVRFSLDSLQIGAGSTSPGALEIIDICSMAQTAVHPLVGFFLDSSDKLRGLYQVQSQPRRLVANCSTLGEYLPVLKRDFPLADFYSLAITLVCSVLQLGETPWLDQPWSKQNIIFLRQRDTSEELVDITHPYLTSEHDVSVFATKGPAQQRGLDRLNMLALAIMLLEINLGTSIESLRRTEDMGSDGNPNAGTDLSVASRCLEAQVYLGNMTSAFMNAITYCLQCYHDPTASFGNPEYLKTVEERVLQPLEREMQLLLYT